MGTITIAVLLLELGTMCFSQDPISNEHGIIMTVEDRYRSPDASIIRHLPDFPGYDNFTNELPGMASSGPHYELRGVDVDFSAKSAYVYDAETQSIIMGDGYNKDLNTTDMEFVQFHGAISAGSDQLAVDWLSHTVYWIDPLFKWIVAAPGQMEKIAKAYYKIIVRDHLDAPAGLAIDPGEVFLFWSDNGKHPKIERSNLLGQERHTIIQKLIDQPESMDVDRVAKRLFWLERSTSSILSCTYDGLDIRHITRVPGTNLLDLAIFKDYVYLSDDQSGEMFTINKITTLELAQTVDLWPEKIHGLAVYSEEIQSLRDTDYCAELNCTQLCFTTTTNATCACAEGHTFNATSGMCEESFAQKAIMFANTTHICMVDIRIMTSFIFNSVCVFTVIEQPAVTATAQADDLIKMFDMNMLDRMFYYVTSDNRIIARPIDLSIEDNAKVQIKASATENITGISYDSEDGYLYWTESVNIYRINVNNQEVNKVNPNNMPLDSPKDIIVVLKQRKLVFTVGEIGNMSIQTLTMDGTVLTYIAQGFHEVVSPTIDQETLIVYFLVPAKRDIYRVEISGTKKPSKTYLYTDPSAYILIHYSNYLSWVYMSDGYAIVTNDYKKRKEIVHGYFDNITQILDMKILDLKLQLPGTFSPCSHENGGCSQLCITSYTNHTMTKLCECRRGYTLDVDKVSCKTGLTDDDFILGADWLNNEVIQLDLQTIELNAVQISESAVFMGIYYDVELARIIWTEHLDTKIYTANLNGSDRHILAETGYSYAHRIEKDTSTGNFYYSGYDYPELGFITPSGQNIVINDDFYWEELTAIAVHPAKGWLYYSVSDGSYSSISRCDMDGENNEQLITGDHVYVPSGLAIDYVNNHLYWSDASFDTIEQCNLDGGDCITIVDMPDGRDSIKDIVTDGEFLYYSAYKRDHLVRVSLTEPYTTVEIGRNLGIGNLDTLSLYKSTNINIQPVTNACEAGGGRGDCSTICLPTPSGRTCMCHEGISLNDDGKTCSDAIRCPFTIQNGSLATACRREVGELCNFSCEVGFMKTDSSTFCNADAVWHATTNELCTPYKCSGSITKGELEAGCSRSVGDSCSVTCEQYYTPISPNLQITCQNDGWDEDVGSICQESTCLDITLSHGKLADGCGKKTGHTCSFSCDSGYESSISTAVCNKELHWYLSHPCTLIKCPDSVPNGKVATGCELTIDSSCSFSCDDTYSPAAGITSIQCMSTGKWNVADGICIAPVVVTAAQTEGYSEGGVITGAVVLLAFIIGLIVVIAILIRRNVSRSSQASNYGTASFHNGGPVAPLTYENLRAVPSVSSLNTTSI